MKNIILLLSLSTLLISFQSCKKKITDSDGVQSTSQESAAPMEGTAFEVNTEMSKVLWNGSKPTGIHTGSVDLSEGQLYMKDGSLTAGSFVIDMNTIACLDLQGEQKESIEAHLKGLNEGEEDDFFNVTKFPTAKFEITKVTNLVSDADASNLVYGNLTLKGVTHSIGFKAKIQEVNGKVLVNIPEFKIDRTRWGIKFMSKSVLGDIKEKFINDDIGIAIKLTTIAS